MRLGWAGVTMLLHANSSHCSWLLPLLQWATFQSCSVLPETGILPGSLSDWEVPRLCTLQQWVQCGLILGGCSGPGHRLPSGLSHWPRPRELWTPEVDSRKPGRSWDFPAQAWSPVPPSKIAIRRLACGVSVLCFIPECKAHQSLSRRKMWGYFLWRSNVRDPLNGCTCCLWSLP